MKNWKSILHGSQASSGKKSERSHDKYKPIKANADESSFSRYRNDSMNNSTLENQHNGRIRSRRTKKKPSLTPLNSSANEIGIKSIVVASPDNKKSQGEIPLLLPFQLHEMRFDAKQIDRLKMSGLKQSIMQLQVQFKVFQEQIIGYLDRQQEMVYGIIDRIVKQANRSIHQLRLRCMELSVPDPLKAMKPQRTSICLLKQQTVSTSNNTADQHTNSSKAQISHSASHSSQTNPKLPTSPQDPDLQRYLSALSQLKKQLRQMNNQTQCNIIKDSNTSLPPTSRQNP